MAFVGQQPFSEPNRVNYEPYFNYTYYIIFFIQLGRTGTKFNEVQL